MLFSATFKKKVERLARDALIDPIRIVIGELGEASEDVTQHVQIFAKQEDKWSWIRKHLVKFLSSEMITSLYWEKTAVAIYRKEIYRRFANEILVKIKICLQQISVLDILRWR